MIELTVLEIFVFVAVITAVATGLFLWSVLYVTEGPVWIVDDELVGSSTESDDEIEQN